MSNMSSRHAPVWLAVLFALAAWWHLGAQQHDVGFVGNAASKPKAAGSLTSLSAVDKALKNRMTSVQKTSKLTDAMRLVAAAKIRKAQDGVAKARPFSDELQSMIKGLVKRFKGSGLEAELPMLRVPEKVNNVWQQWVKHWGETAKFLGLVACTSAAEICTETFSQCKGASVKMHLHVFGHAKNKMHHYSPQSARCVFQRKIPWSNCVPGINFRDFSRAGTGKEAESDNKNVWAGHYYLSCQAKLGSVFVQSTHRAFKGYAVQPQWVTKWVQAVVFVVIMFCFDASVTFYGLPPNVVLIMLSPTIFCIALYLSLSR